MRTLPWTGGTTVSEGAREWRLERPWPREVGWYCFRTFASYAATGAPAADAEQVRAAIDLFPKAQRVTGYLVGDLLLPDDATTGRSWCPSCRGFLQGGAPFTGRMCGTCHTETVAAVILHLVTERVERFGRVTASRPVAHHPLLFAEITFPLGPEADVQAAYEDRAPSLAAVAHTTPALRAAYQLEWWHRADAEARRARAEAERQAEERRQDATRNNSAGHRRELAKTDFPEAARRALALSGAELLDTSVYRKGEMLVRYRVAHRRLECVVESDTLRVTDAGVCLTDHRTGRKGDTDLVLESLPPVIMEAIKLGKLVVFRHGADPHGEDEGADDAWGDDE